MWELHLLLMRFSQQISARGHVTHTKSAKNSLSFALFRFPNILWDHLKPHNNIHPLQERLVDTDGPTPHPNTHRACHIALIEVLKKNIILKHFQSGKTVLRQVVKSGCLFSIPKTAASMPAGLF